MCVNKVFIVFGFISLLTISSVGALILGIGYYEKDEYAKSTCYVDGYEILESQCPTNNYDNSYTIICYNALVDIRYNKLDNTTVYTQFRLETWRSSETLLQNDVNELNRATCWYNTEDANDVVFSEQNNEKFLWIAIAIFAIGFICFVISMFLACLCSF